MQHSQARSTVETELMIHPERLDLKSLARFLAVVEHGSFAKAARAINLTQQAVAYSIASLEDVVGVPLFERDQLGAVPTHYGKRLTIHARAILTEARRAADGLQALQTAKAGAVRIGVSEIFAGQIVPIAIARLLDRHPDIELSVREGPSTKMCELLHKGEVDLVVGAPPITMALDDNVEQQLLFEDHDLVVMRAGHPLAECKQPTLADFQSMTWLVSHSRQEDYQSLCESFLVAGLEPPRHFVRSDGLATGLSLLLATDWVCLTCLWVAPQMMNPSDGGLYRALRVDGLGRRRRAFLRVTRGVTLSAAALELVGEIRRVASERLPGAGPG